MATSTVVPDAPVGSPTEQSVDELIGVGASIASPFIKNASSQSLASSLVGLSPVAVHLGFLLAHLFQHHANTVAQPPAPVKQ